MTKSIWATLSAIDCSKHVDKKGGFDYLSWSWAWAMVKEHYPLANYRLEDDVHYADGSMEVRVTVIVEDQEAIMWLPVLDFRNKAISNPNSFDINSARMRCLVKCCAVGFGLGHYIYAGESAPVGETFTPEQLASFNMMVANGDGWAIKRFNKALTEAGQQHIMDDLFNSAPKGQITALKSKVRELVQSSNSELKTIVAALQEAIANNSGDSIAEIYDELDPENIDIVNAGMTEIEHIQMKKLTEEA